MNRDIKELERLYGEPTPYTFLNELDFNRADTVLNEKGELTVYIDAKNRVKNTRLSIYEQKIEKRLRENKEKRFGYITSCKCRKCKNNFLYRRKGKKRFYCGKCKRKK